MCTLHMGKYLCVFHWCNVSSVVGHALCEGGSFDPQCFFDMTGWPPVDGLCYCLCPCLWWRSQLLNLIGVHLWLSTFTEDANRCPFKLAWKKFPTATGGRQTSAPVSKSVQIHSFTQNTTEMRDRNHGFQPFVLSSWNKANTCSTAYFQIDMMGWLLDHST